MIEAGKDTFKCYKDLTIKDAILMISYAWNEVNKSTINNCFKHAKWIESCYEDIIYDDNLSELFIEFVDKAKIIDPITKDEFIEISYVENDVILEELTRKEIEQKQDVNSFELYLSDSETVIEDELLVSDKECYAALQTIKNYFNQKEYTSEAILGIDLISKALKKRRKRFSFKSWKH